MGAEHAFKRAAVAAVVAATLGAGCGRIWYAEVGPDAGAAVDFGPMPADFGPVPDDLGPMPDDLGPMPDDLGPMPDGGPLDATTEPDAGRCPGPITDAVCARLAAIPDAPVIDGVVECGLTLVPLVPRAWTSTTPIPSGHSAELAVAWHPDGVYFFVHVVSPTVRAPGATDDTYCGDGVEVYLDADGVFAAAPAYDRPGTRQFIIPAPTGASSTRASAHVDAATALEWAAGRAIAVRTGDGYVVEAFVKREDVFLTPGAFVSASDVGIDVSVNVAAPVDAGGTCGRRLGQYFLNATNRAEPPAGRCDGLPFCDVSAFCTPQLAPPGG